MGTSMMLGASVAAAGAREEDACRARLGMLHEAICAWKRRFGDFPPDLGTLLRQGFVADQRWLVCPGVEKDLSYKSVGAGTLTSTIFDNEATYEYELDERAPMNARLVRGLAHASRRAWRKDLMKTALGKVLPIVRCQRHTKCWNVTGEGRSYLSGPEWEYNYVDLLPEIYAMPFLAHTRNPSIHEHAGSRPDRLGSGCIDLKDAANALPGDPWLDGFKSGDSLDDFVSGTRGGYQSESGMQFDCRYLVQVCGKVGNDSTWMERKAFAGPAYPRVSRPISLACRTGDRIHMIHACAYRGEVGEVAGAIVLEDEDGAELQSKALVYGRDTSVWRAQEFKKPSFTPPLWTGSAGKALEAETGMKAWEARLFLHTMPMDAAMSESTRCFLRLRANEDSPTGPFIVAITVSH